MDTFSSVTSTNTANIIELLHNLKGSIDFSNFNNKKLFLKNKKEEVVGKFKAQTPKNFWIDEIICSKSKACSFICGNGSKNELKGTSQIQPKIIEFEEINNCLFGVEYRRECDYFLFCSINVDIYLQKKRKTALTAFDDQRYYINEIESIP